MWSRSGTGPNGSHAANIGAVPGAWVRGLVKPSVGFVDSGIA
jgi:hypothetical protein